MTHPGSSVGGTCSGAGGLEEKEAACVAADSFLSSEDEHGKQGTNGPQPCSRRVLTGQAGVAGPASSTVAAGPDPGTTEPGSRQHPAFCDFSVAS